MAKFITEKEYQDHCDNEDGFCSECHDFTRDGMTEPDAEDYPCPECEQNTCVGTEQALILGLIEIRED